VLDDCVACYLQYRTMQSESVESIEQLRVSFRARVPGTVSAGLATMDSRTELQWSRGTVQTTYHSQSKLLLISHQHRFLV
jgi:hypothetical protein